MEKGLTLNGEEWRGREAVCGIICGTGGRRTHTAGESRWRYTIHTGLRSGGGGVGGQGRLAGGEGFVPLIVHNSRSEEECVKRVIGHE
jgi:hypothetical protein